MMEIGMRRKLEITFQWQFFSKINFSLEPFGPVYPVITRIFLGTLNNKFSLIYKIERNRYGSVLQILREVDPYLSGLPVWKSSSRSKWRDENWTNLAMRRPGRNTWSGVDCLSSLNVVATYHPFLFCSCSLQEILEDCSVDRAWTIAFGIVIFIIYGQGYFTGS